ncbi:MAG: DUF1353 domain-containing protein [Pseudomonadota bacterium]
MTWEPGEDPFPKGDVKRISDFEYLDELKFVRHARVHVQKTPESLWQLAGDFRARMRVHLKDGTSYDLTLTAPRGMYTDLASVPQALWLFIGPIGSHLEASIIHDYLYMAWTDYRDEARKRDWDFADSVFLAGLKVSKTSTRVPIYLAVRLMGWFVFRAKSYTLKERMNEWLPLLAPSHQR